MASKERHQAGEKSSHSIEVISNIFEELERVDRATKRLSLTDKCPTCGQTVPSPSKLPFRNSYQNAAEFVEIPLVEESLQPVENEEIKTTRGVRFWFIIMALIVVGAVAALEGTIVGTALPTIVNDLGGAQLYVWTVNVYFLSSMVFQPLCGQMSNIFGRKALMVFSITIFLIGSAFCGASQNMKTLIAGRAVQGSGAGGMNMLAHVIVSDIIPLRERGSFMAIIYLAIAVGTGVGPIAGGLIVEKTTWRWVFLLNLPVGGLALLLVIAFLKVKHNNSKSTVTAKLKRIDYIGNAIFIPSVASILLALTWAGTDYAWSSWRILLSLTAGFAGLGAFLVFEWSTFCLEPTMPRRLFTNRTTVSALFLSLINSLILYWMLYWLPVYFQSVLESSPIRSGVQLLPFVLVMTPFGALAGKALAKFGRYRIIHHLAFAFLMIGLGLITTLGASSPTSAWICFQILVAAGCGFTSTTTLPAIQAPLDDSDTAAATGTWAFVRSFGTVLAVPIPAAIFNNKVDNLSGRIGNPLIRQMLLNGHAYEHATSSFVKLFHGTLKAEIIGVYSDSLQLVWQVAIGIAGLGFLFAFLEKEINLRTDLKTDYGIEEKKKRAKSEGVVEA